MEKFCMKEGCVEPFVSERDEINGLTIFYHAGKTFSLPDERGLIDRLSLGRSLKALHEPD